MSWVFSVVPSGKAGAGSRAGAAVEAEVSFSEQGAARQPLLLDSHR